jgi:hypothetical protein
VDGALLVQGNQIVHAGYPNLVPPGPESRRPIDPHKPGYGRGIYAWALQDVQIVGNSISHGRGPGISTVGVTHGIVNSNMVSADLGAGLNTSGIMIDSSKDVQVANNNVRGFAVGVGVQGPPFGKSDRVQIRGNSVDVGVTGSVGISIPSNLDRVQVTSNVVTSTSPSASCVVVAGTNATVTRTVRDNECW